MSFQIKEKACCERCGSYTDLYTCEENQVVSIFCYKCIIEFGEEDALKEFIDKQYRGWK